MTLSDDQHNETLPDDSQHYETLPDDSQHYETLPDDQFYDVLPEEQSVTKTNNITVNSHDENSCALRQYLLG